jgi:hypothetical protein
MKTNYVHFRMHAVVGLVTSKFNIIICFHTVQERFHDSSWFSAAVCLSSFVEPLEAANMLEKTISAMMGPPLSTSKHKKK